MAVRVARSTAALACVAASLGAGAQALSNVYADKNPVLAVALSPYASDALEQLTLARLRTGADGLTLDASDAAILSISQETPAGRRASTAAVARLSRRGRILNFAILQDAISRNDAQQSIDALNNLFFIYPGFVPRFLPTMVSYLGDPSNISQLRKILETDPAWADDFFVSNVSGEVLVNMAQLRIALGDSVTLTEETDRHLVARLASAGLWTESFDLRERLTDDVTITGEEAINWQADYPPFDWNLADDRHLYARPDTTGLKLRIRIAPGQGGLLASRVVNVPADARSLSLSHSLVPASGLENLTLSATCVESQTELAATAFRPMTAKLTFNGERCDWIAIAIAGRAWSNESAITGEIDRLEFGR
jgi:hypothetical protein